MSKPVYLASGNFYVPSDSEPTPCVAYQVRKYTGHGEGSLAYFAKTETGEWRAFLKKDNTHLKLPSAKTLTWGEWQYDGYKGYSFAATAKTEERPL